MSQRSFGGGGGSLPVLMRFPGHGEAGGEIILPERIGRLYELAYNLWWSWNEDGRQVFRSLDYAQWRACGHNPVRQLREVSPDKLKAAAVDPAFLELYDSVMLQFDADLSGDNTWYFQERPVSSNSLVLLQLF